MKQKKNCPICQRTLIFPNFSTIYPSFPSATFHCTYLYYSSTSTIIPEHFQLSLSTALSSTLLSSILLSSVLSFTFLSSPLDKFSDKLHLQPLDLFLSSSVLFLSLFLSSFPMLPCLTFYIQSLGFHSHIVIVGHPLAGLYPFLLESSARCANYCTLNLPIN